MKNRMIPCGLTMLIGLYINVTASGIDFNATDDGSTLENPTVMTNASEPYFYTWAGYMGVGYAILTNATVTNTYRQWIGYGSAASTGDLHIGAGGALLCTNQYCYTYVGNYGVGSLRIDGVAPNQGYLYSDSITLGQNGGTGTLRISGDGQIEGGYMGLTVGYGGNGYFYMDGGRIALGTNVAGIGMYIGSASGGTGYVYQADGEIRHDRANKLYVGYYDNTYGYYEISGGQVVFTNTVYSTMHIGGTNSGVGVFHVNGSGASQIFHYGSFNVNTNGTLRFTIDTNGVTPINYTFRYAYLNAGSTLDLGLTRAARLKFASLPTNSPERVFTLIDNYPVETHYIATRNIALAPEDADDWEFGYDTGGVPSATPKRLYARYKAVINNGTIFCVK